MSAAQVLLPVAACLAAWLAVGCGRDELDAFREDRLAPLEQRIDGQRAQLSARLRAVQAGSARDAAALRGDLAGLAAAARDAATLDAPEAAADAKDAYADAAARLTRELRRFARALERGAEDALARATDRTRDALGALQQARIELDQAVAS